jgi:hypothetical protein
MIWITEYSPTQKCFHITTLDDAIRHNQGGILAGSPPFYLPIGYFATQESASDYVRRFKEKLHG